MTVQWFSGNGPTLTEYIAAKDAAK
jgi:hypothetical protein